MSTTPETVGWKVTIVPEPKKPDVGFKVIKTEKVVVDTSIVIALSDKAFDFITKCPVHAWTAPNGVVLLTTSGTSEFRVDGDRLQFYMSAVSFRGKRCDATALAFHGYTKFAANIDKVGEALKALASAVATAQPVMSMFDGLDVY